MKTIKSLPLQKSYYNGIENNVYIAGKKFHWTDGYYWISFALDNIEMINYIDDSYFPLTDVPSDKREYQLLAKNTEQDKPEIPLHFQSGHLTRTVTAMPLLPDDSDAMPASPAMLATDTMTILDTSAFLHTLKCSVLFVSKDPAKEQLSFIQCHLENEKMSIVATDGQRLIENNLAINRHQGNSTFDLYLTPALAKYLIKNLDKTHNIILEYDNVQKVVKLEIGQDIYDPEKAKADIITLKNPMGCYPDYKDLIKGIDQGCFSFSIETKELKEILNLFNKKHQLLEFVEHDNQIRCDVFEYYRDEQDRYAGIGNKLGFYDTGIAPAINTDATKNEMIFDIKPMKDFPKIGKKATCYIYPKSPLVRWQIDDAIVLTMTIAQSKSK